MSIQLEIVSPEKVVVSQKVDMAVLPGLEGDIAAMEGHVPMILLLRGGVIHLYEGDKITDSFFVESGFAEMQETKCTVLAKEVKKLDELSEETASKRLADLEESYKVASKGNDAERQRELIDEMQNARVMLELATSVKK
ncbi:FoF1-type ATP synthase [Commensalibacter communis]|uniref:ATP synthase epsilon chain n=1 Tax=Commensalibacter communis TaxID=2972786 RepID=A0A9W4X8H8_9PROT|nr:ATP synthase F1 subunit epsilon [Commensalibacter communis]CAI3922113.1 FoF1-type ATP synthase [Commensalibacter communis]CAI3922297.1 FoF1-type ATP synthase [Commensalibacter communis]CAI3922376.1 FoF1-type ATP synthase [Commensalibacter communis]CAI3922504.1 FoF1-type ATP synthase [Commensalibacter communis]CAI3922972.1 FoF1-type ATP synthase [Commensalibacter communis]